jgi:hypothetical protein
MHILFQLLTHKLNHSVSCSSNKNILMMDMMHSTNSHAAGYKRYGLDLNRNHDESSQHNAYWQWQHSDGSSSEGFHQQSSIFNANHWDVNRPLQPDACSVDMQPSPYFTKHVPEWNDTCFRYSK